MGKELEHGDSVPGLLIDGAEETPHLGVTLTYGKMRGVQVEIPYINDEESKEFAHVLDWRLSERIPENLQVLTLGGVISLFGCRYAGHNTQYPSGLTVARIAPREVIFGIRDGEFSDPLKIDNLSSEIDGLSEWTMFRPIKQETQADEENRIKKAIITAESVDKTSWIQGDARLELRSGWSAGSTSSDVRVSGWVTLTSSFGEPRDTGEHLAEQSKVAMLLKFIFGRQISFRKQKIRDGRFLEYGLDGTVQDEMPSVSILISRTLKDQGDNSSEAFRPLVNLEEFGLESLERWADQYDRWNRFILPAASALSRRGNVMENDVLSFSMALEAAGNLIGKVAGEEETLNAGGKPTTATYSFRCIQSTGIEWGQIAESPVALARALANNYNTIKHYDRGEFPDAAETYLSREVLMLVTRLVALRIAHPNGDLLRKAGLRSFMSISQSFKSYGLKIDISGAFASRE